MKEINFIDLFAGMGGMRYGFSYACDVLNKKHNCVLTSEIKPYALKVYNEFYKETNEVNDITKIETTNFHNVDFILAGFPCQPFSYAGKGLGFADTRGTMFFETYRFIKDLKPKGFLLENVEGLTTHDNGRTFKTILSILEDLDYKISYKVINSKDFGLAQERKRIYICGSLYDYPNLDYIPKNKVVFGEIRDFNHKTINSSFTQKLCEFAPIEHLQGKCIRDKRAGKNNIHSWDLELRGKLNNRQKDILNFILQERRKKSLANKYNVVWKDGMPVPFSHLIDNFTNIPKDILEEDLNTLLSKNYLKLENKNDIIGYSIPTGVLSFPITRILSDNHTTPTIVATDVSRIGVTEKNGIRNLTTNELLKLFGYPINYPLSLLPKNEQFDLMGNTVCIPVIKFCCENILKTFI